MRRKNNKKQGKKFGDTEQQFSLSYVCVFERVCSSIIELEPVMHPHSKCLFKEWLQRLSFH